MSEMPAMLDVRAFGAVGDGKTDSTVALQKAIDTAAQSQATVYLPEGVFLTGALRWRPKVGMAGNPTWTYRQPGGSVLRLNDPSARCLIDLTDGIGATLNGLCLEGGRLGSGVHGILMDKADYGKEEDCVRIERCRVAAFSGDGIRLKRVWCFSIRSCIVFCNAGSGVWIRGWDGFLLDNWLSGNGGAGYAAFEENLSVTMTGNRIEWNAAGGIVCRGGGHYNITGNYIDRSGGPGIWFADRGEVHSAVISAVGNVIYRSGKPEWCPADDPYASSHARFEGVQGLVFTGNTMNLSRDDRASGQLSPQYGIVIRGLESSVIKDNVLHSGALKQLVVDLGGHAGGVVLADNVGTIYDPATMPPSRINAAYADPAW